MKTGIIWHLDESFHMIKMIWQVEKCSFELRAHLQSAKDFGCESRRGKLEK